MQMNSEPAKKAKNLTLQLLGNHKKIAELPIETAFTDSHIFMMIMIPAAVVFPFQWKLWLVFHWVSLFYDTS